MSFNFSYFYECNFLQIWDSNVPTNKTIKPVFKWRTAASADLLYYAFFLTKHLVLWVGFLNSFYINNPANFTQKSLSDSPASDETSVGCAPSFLALSVQRQRQVSNVSKHLVPAPMLGPRRGPRLRARDQVPY